MRLYLIIIFVSIAFVLKAQQGKTLEGRALEKMKELDKKIKEREVKMKELEEKLKTMGYSQELVFNLTKLNVGEND